MARKQSYAQQKHAEKQALAEKKQSVGLVSERYPEVTELTMRLTYFSPMLNGLFLVRTVNFFPGSNAYFHMNCMVKECSNGGFDLTRKVSGLIKGRKKLVKGEMICCNCTKNLPSDHARISYEISVRYNRRNGKRNTQGSKRAVSKD